MGKIGNHNWISIFFAIFIISLILVPEYAYGSEAAPQLKYPVRIVAVDVLSKDTIPTSAIQIAISTTTGSLLYSGPAPSSGIVRLPAGRYSIYVQSEGHGFNATIVAINGPTTVTIPIGPYVLGYLIDLKTNKSYYRPTDPSLIARLVLGVDQSSNLPLFNRSSSVSPYDTCQRYWVLYNRSYLGQRVQLQGAVYSWGVSPSDQVQNTPTVTQYSVTYNYESLNGGGLSIISSTAVGYTIQTYLPTACKYCGSSEPWNYDVAMQGTWYDYVYHDIDSCSDRTVAVRDDIVMTNGSNWFPKDSQATSTNDYSFSPFTNFAVGHQNSARASLTLSQVGTQTISFSVEGSLCVSRSYTGGEYNGCFNIAGYAGLNSQVSGTTVEYQLYGIDYCGSFVVYKSGWVIYFSQGTPVC